MPPPLDAQPEPHRIAVPAALWPVVCAWMAVQTQWRHGWNGPTGLDYAAVRVALVAMRIRITPDLWADLQTLERKALAERASW